MKWMCATGLVILLFCVILFTGCTGKETTPLPAVTPAPQVVYVTVTVTPAVTASPAATTVVPVATVTNATPAADPVIHRYIYQYMTANGPMGHELKFYPGGTVDYRIGYTTTITDNIIITKIVSEASGTWIPLGKMVYYIKVLPTAEGGAQIIRQFTLVPAHEDPRYPGITLPEKLVGSDGTVMTRAKND
ncbi:hypothetical protein [uncultured Methanoregula sp.]|uniref:hypothetical protein n=1 Tax=uncultured Methanoregula sp. TaxID=1005933 RepID=UPI002AAA628E|nr:hypothetical protein [uncultured Methanoregula sp.]